MGEVPGTADGIDEASDVPIACSLDAADLAGRAEEVRSLLTAELIGRERTSGGLRLRFPATPGMEDRLRDLMAREKACCPFFDFALERGERELTLEMRAPEAARAFVDDLFATGADAPSRAGDHQANVHAVLSSKEAGRTTGLAESATSTPRTGVAPLEGRRVLVTRPAGQAAELAHLLREKGAEPVLLPAVEIRPLEDTTRLDRVLARVLSYDWVIFTSANGVRHVWERLAALGIEDVLEDGEDGHLPMQPHVAAIGPGTAAALERRGVRPEYVPRRYVAEALARGLPDAEHARILLLRADISRSALRDLLEARGARVEDVTAYRTVAGAAVAGARALTEVDAVTFTSSSTVRGFLKSAGGVPDGVAVICIGPITAGTARELGVRVDAVAETYTIPGLVEALVRHFNDSRGRQPAGDSAPESEREEGEP